MQSGGSSYSDLGINQKNNGSQQRPSTYGRWTGVSDIGDQKGEKSCQSLPKSIWSGQPVDAAQVAVIPLATTPLFPNDGADYPFTEADSPSLPFSLTIVGPHSPSSLFFLEDGPLASAHHKRTSHLIRGAKGTKTLLAKIRESLRSKPSPTSAFNPSPHGQYIRQSIRTIDSRIQSSHNTATMADEYVCPQQLCCLFTIDPVVSLLAI